MTNDPVRPGLHPLSNLKAGPTISSPTLASLPIYSTVQLPPPSPSPSRSRHKKNPSRDEQALDPTSDKATVALIRRVLCPGTGSYGTSTPQPIEELLPPLTSSNAVDRQLYALLAIIIKEFVYSWYSKLTPDHLLVNEVLQVIAHCTRALEQRLRHVDLAQLVFDELPALVESHIISYRLAQQQSNLSGLPTSKREIYHALNPHPGLSPVPDPSDAQTVDQQRENEGIYRQLLVNGALAVLLPTEDLENACLRTLVGDILADLILGNEVSGRACEGWFLWESVIKLIDVVRRRKTREESPDTAQKAPHGRLEKFGLLSSKGELENDHSSTETQSRIQVWIWSFLQMVYMAYVALRFIVTGLLRVASTPAVSFSPTSTNPIKPYSTEAPPSTDSITGKRPVLDYRLYGMLSQLLDVPRRMPWLGGLLALFQYLILAGPGKLGDTDSVLDRFLHETIQNYLLTPTLLPNLLLATRSALFPQNARAVQTALKPANGATAQVSAVSDNTAPTSPPPSGRNPSSAEIAAIKRQCAVSILSLIPRNVARVFFGVSSPVIICQERCRRQEDHVTQAQSTAEEEEDDDILTAIEEDLLGLFADEYCNKHLIYSILETVLARLLPELSERSVCELMEDRGVVSLMD